MSRTQRADLSGPARKLPPSPFPDAPAPYLNSWPDWEDLSPPAQFLPAALQMPTSWVCPYPTDGRSTCPSHASISHQAPRAPPTTWPSPSSVISKDLISVSHESPPSDVWTNAVYRRFTVSLQTPHLQEIINREKKGCHCFPNLPQCLTLQREDGGGAVQTCGAEKPGLAPQHPAVGTTQPGTAQCSSPPALWAEALLSLSAADFAPL